MYQGSPAIAQLLAYARAGAARPGIRWAAIPDRFSSSDALAMKKLFSSRLPAAGGLKVNGTAGKGLAARFRADHEPLNLWLVPGQELLDLRFDGIEFHIDSPHLARLK